MKIWQLVLQSIWDWADKIMKDKNLNIKVSSGTKIAVVGDIHEHEEQFDKLLDIIQPSEKMLFVSVGDIYDKGYGPRTAESITDKIRKMVDAGYGFAVRGNHELKNIKRAKMGKKISDQLAWFDKQPLALSFEFDNRSRLTVVHGGVKPSHTWDDLNFDIETSYIRDLDFDGEMIKLIRVVENNVVNFVPNKPNGISWHHTYDGRLGYIIAGHDPLKDGEPKFYNYSCNIDTACYYTGILTCQVFDENGLNKLHSIKGMTKNKN